MQALYIGISIAAFIAILVLLVLNRRKINGISTLTTLGMTMKVSDSQIADMIGKRRLKGTIRRE
jgi:hypothetical protein